MYLKPINCSAGGAVLAGCVGFVATTSSHHSGKAARKLEKLSVIALKENITKLQLVIGLHGMRYENLHRNFCFRLDPLSFPHQVSHCFNVVTG